MIGRVGVIILNTYREAVRARLLHGLFGVALATTAYAAIVGHYASHSAMRVVSDIGAASISLYAIIVSVVIGATSLYRELELKTIFPILARPIRRGEYLVGKYLGIIFTLAVFVTANVGVLLLTLGFMSDRPLWQVLGLFFGSIVVAGVLAWQKPRWRSTLPVVWALVVTVLAWKFADDAPAHRRVVVYSAILSLCEVGIVTAIAMVFASFSSPFLTAVLTLGVFIVGRSADTLARLPERVFGTVIKEGGEAIAKVVPNLMFYVPPRPVLTGEAADVVFGPYALQAFIHALLWSVFLLALASIIFRRRDFL